MIPRANGRIYECVAVDLNTQRDFCNPDGAYPVTNLDDLIPSLRRVIAWTKRNAAPVISSLDSHRPMELTTYGHPLCCIDGSNGQRKIGFTLFPRCARVEFDNTLSVPLDLFAYYQQLIFNQRTDDLLGNPKADQFLTHVSAQEFILFGNTVEHAIKALALGLRARDKLVTVVIDACGYWNRGSADLALRQVEAKGASLVTVDDLLHRKLTRHLRYRIRSHDSPVAGRHSAPQGPSANGESNGNGRNGNGHNHGALPLAQVNHRIPGTNGKGTKPGE